MVMRVICVGNRGSDLSESALSRSGNFKSTKFQLTVDGAYAVYAMAISRGSLMLLVLNDGVRPIWAHVELFDFTDAKLPSGWSFVKRDEGIFGISALWGYRSMIENPSHNDDLMERERSAWRDFLADNEQAFEEGPDQEKIRTLSKAFNSGLTFSKPPSAG